MSEYTFQDIDPEGIETLESISAADRFNCWMFDTIKPFCSGKILEIGSGIGNISKYFIESNANIVLSDIRENYRDSLAQTFSESSPQIENIDIVDDNFDQKHSALIGKFDTVYALNVFEHVDNIDKAIVNSKKLLKTGGKLIVLVPAYNFLYNEFDKQLGHYRRYTCKSLKEHVGKEFAVLHSCYFNAIGTLGWFVSGSILRKKTIPKGQMKFYNALVPLFKLIDRLLFRRYGLSAIVVGEKNN